MKTLVPPAFERPSTAIRRRADVVSEVPRAMLSSAPELSLRRALANALGTDAEPKAWLAFARYAEGRGGDIREAVLAYERVLLFGDDPNVRKRLAALHVSLGEPGLAAAEYVAAAELATGAEQIVALRQAALFYARDGAYSQAYAALSRARSRDPHDGVTLRLSAALHRVAPETVSRVDARNALLEAAEVAGRRDFTETLLRTALELDPQSPDVVEACRKLDERAPLPTQLVRARSATAPLLREHVLTLGTQAIQQGLATSALGLWLENLLDFETVPELAAALDRVLVLCGLPLAVAARLEVRALAEKGSARVDAWNALANFALHDLVDGGLALAAFGHALADTPPLAVVSPLALGEVESLAHAGFLREAVDTLSGVLRIRKQREERIPTALSALLLTLAIEAKLPAYMYDACVCWLREEPEAPLALSARDGCRDAFLRLEEEASVLDTSLAFATAEEAESLASELCSILDGMPERAMRLAELLRARTSVQPDDAAALLRAFVVRGLRASDARATAFELKAALARVRPRLWNYFRVALSLDVQPEASTPAAPVVPELARSFTEVGFGVSSSLTDVRQSVGALVALSRHVPDTLASELQCVAASRLLTAARGQGATADLGSALAYAENALATEATSARAAVLITELSLALGAGVEPAIIHSAIVACGPRGTWLHALCKELEQRELNAESTRAARAWVDLVPGDLDAANSYLKNVAMLADPTVVAEAISWILAQPIAQRELGARVADMLAAVVRSKPTTASRLTLLALDGFGLRQAGLRDVFLDVVTRTADDTLATTVLERWLASGAPQEEQAELWIALSRARMRTGDKSGAARAGHRAVLAGAAGEAFQRFLHELRADESPLDGDGIFALTQIDAELALRHDDAAGYAGAMRVAGAVVWDAALDRPEAVRIWLQGARYLPGTGVVRLGADLRRFAGDAEAERILTELAEAEADVVFAGSLSAEAARAAMLGGRLTQAFTLAVVALQKNPHRTDALEAAERGSIELGRTDAMEPLFHAVAKRARGRFGRRAAHYRAARFFEARGESALALSHAARAVVAVPGENLSFALLQRVASRVSDRTEAVEALAKLGESVGKGTEAARWLSSAASLCAPTVEGRRRRLELTRSALLSAPSPALVRTYATAASELLAGAPDWRGFVADELTSLRVALGKAVEGPDGARVFLALAEVGHELDSTHSPLVEIASALELAGDLEEFAELVPLAPEFAKRDYQAAGLALCVACLQRPYANIGDEAADFLGALAECTQNLPVTLELAVRLIQVKRRNTNALLEAARIVAAHPDLISVYRAQVTEAQEAEALAARARSHIQEGRFDAAANDFEAALALASAPSRPKLEAELQALYASREAMRAARASGRVSEAAPASPQALCDAAARWEDAGELGEALALYRRAATLDPRDAATHRAIASLCEQTFDDRGYVDALSALAKVASDEEQPAVLKTLAHALLRLGERERAKELWTALGRRLPDDDEVRAALLALASESGSAENLLHQLALRLTTLRERGASPDEVRALRFRRAAILEQRVARPAEAAAELESIVAEGGDSAARALRYLGDLWERARHDDLALAAFDRLRELAGDNFELESRRAQLLAKVGRLDDALALAEVLRRSYGGRPELLKMAAGFYQQKGAHLELGATLELLAHGAEDDLDVRSDWLIDAADAAMQTGDIYGALARAQKAAALTPSRAKPQLYARSLEYRLRGVGTPDEARAIAASLAEILPPETDDQLALKAFLHAEALDALEGRGAGFRAVLGTWDTMRHPLLALALAERHVARFRFNEALPFFEVALSGDLLSFRRRGMVALAAADAAARANDDRAYRHFLGEALLDPSTAAIAHRQSLDEALRVGDSHAAGTHLVAVLNASSPDARARLQNEIFPMFAAAQVPWPSSFDHPDMRDSLLPRIPLSLAIKMGEDVEYIETAQSMRYLEEPPALVQRVLQEPRELRADIGMAVTDDFVGDGLTDGVLQALSEIEAGPVSVSLPSARVAASLAAPNETTRHELEAEARAGSADAADALAELAERSDGGGTQDIFRYRRMAAELAPGDLRRLELLLAAAARDRQTTYARATQHLLAAMRHQPTNPIPALASQREQPGMLTLLTRHSQEPAGQVLRLLWEHGGGALMRAFRIPSTLPAGERVIPSAATPLSRAVQSAAQLLGLPNLPLFHANRDKPLSIEVQLNIVPSVRIVGLADRDSSALAHAVGEAVSAVALPQNAVLLADAALAGRIWGVIYRAFGPEEHPDAADDMESRLLVDLLWQVLPGRIQRRIETLLRSGATASLSLARERARHSGRRVGFFLSGDFMHAARSVLDDFGETSALSAENLVQLCAFYPSLADLYRLAIRPEFVDARFVEASTSLVAAAERP